MKTSMSFDKDGSLIFTEIEEIDEVKKEQAQKIPKLDLFRDILHNIVAEKTALEWSMAEKTYDCFVLNRCISLVDLDLACRLNEMGSKISPEVHYKVLHKKIQPKRKRFLKFLKPPLVNKDLKLIADFFHATPREMESYLSLLKREDIDLLLSKLNNLDVAPEKKKLKQ